MKSKEIRHWKRLSYCEIANLDDFKQLLEKALTSRKCMLCRYDTDLRHGLCGMCENELEGIDRDLALCMDRHVVKIKVILPKKFPWQKKTKNNLKAYRDISKQVQN